MPDSPSPTVTWPSADLWRVERTTPVLQPAHLNPVDAAIRSGNRFDIPGAGVLYASTNPEGAFAETLALFRPSAILMSKLGATEPLDGKNYEAGLVPAEWRHSRRLRTVRLPNSLPFIDIESAATHTYLTRHASEVLLAQNVENLDVAVVRGPNRLLTRALATWIYSQTNERGDALCSGIRYVSRLGNYECWAIFDGTPMKLVAEQTIDPQLPAVASVAAAFGLTVR